MTALRTAALFVVFALLQGCPDPDAPPPDSADGATQADAGDAAMMSEAGPPGDGDVQARPDGMMPPEGDGTVPTPPDGGLMPDMGVDPMVPSMDPVEVPFMAPPVFADRLQVVPGAMMANIPDTARVWRVDGTQEPFNAFEVGDVVIVDGDPMYFVRVVAIERDGDDLTVGVESAGIGDVIVNGRITAEIDAAPLVAQLGPPRQKIEVGPFIAEVDASNEVLPVVATAEAGIISGEGQMHLELNTATFYMTNKLNTNFDISFEEGQVTDARLNLETAIQIELDAILRVQGTIEAAKNCQIFPWNRCEPCDELPAFGVAFYIPATIPTPFGPIPVRIPGFAAISFNLGVSVTTEGSTNVRFGGTVVWDTNTGFQYSPAGSNTTIPSIDQIEFEPSELELPEELAEDALAVTARLEEFINVKVRIPGVRQQNMTPCSDSPSLQGILNRLGEVLLPELNLGLFQEFKYRFLPPPSFCTFRWGMFFNAQLTLNLPELPLIGDALSGVKLLEVETKEFPENPQEPPFFYQFCGECDADGQCEPDFGETCETCPDDCGECGQIAWTLVDGNPGRVVALEVTQASVAPAPLDQVDGDFISVGNRPADLAMWNVGGVHFGIVSNRADDTVSLLRLSRNGAKELDADRDPDTTDPDAPQGITRISVQNPNCLDCAAAAPSGVAVDPYGDYAVVTLLGTDEVAIIDLHNRRVSRWVSVGYPYDLDPLGVGANPRPGNPIDVAILPARGEETQGRIFVSLYGTNREPGQFLAVVETCPVTACVADVRWIDAGRNTRPAALAIDSTETYLAVSLLDNDRVSLIDLDTETELDLFPVEAHLRRIESGNSPQVLEWVDGTLYMGNIAGTAGSAAEEHGSVIRADVYPGQCADNRALTCDDDGCGDACNRGRESYDVGICDAVRGMAWFPDLGTLLVGDSRGLITALPEALFTGERALCEGIAPNRELCAGLNAIESDCAALGAPPVDHAGGCYDARRGEGTACSPAMNVGNTVRAMVRPPAAAETYEGGGGKVLVGTITEDFVACQRRIAFDEEARLLEGPLPAHAQLGAWLRGELQDAEAIVVNDAGLAGCSLASALALPLIMNDPGLRAKTTFIDVRCEEPGEGGPAPLDCGCRVDDGDDDLDEDDRVDLCDNCPREANPEQADTDNDQYGDVCDNCVDTYQNDQSDRDDDGAGDACDECPDDPEKTEPGLCGCGRSDDLGDSDGDGVPNCDDNCPDDANEDQADRDADRIGDACDGCPDLFCQNNEDPDGDGTPFCCDNCTDLPNPDQADLDGDGVGDLCDVCPAVSDPTQVDSDGDGVGDACADCNDGPDSDGDGVGDLCDVCPGSDDAAGCAGCVATHVCAPTGAAAEVAVSGEVTYLVVPAFAPNVPGTLWRVTQGAAKRLRHDLAPGTVALDVHDGRLLTLSADGADVAVTSLDLSDGADLGVLDSGATAALFDTLATTDVFVMGDGTDQVSRLDAGLAAFADAGAPVTALTADVTSGEVYAVAGQDIVRLVPGGGPVNVAAVEGEATGLTAHDGTLWVLDYCTDCGRIATLVREIDAATGAEQIRCATPMPLQSLDVDPGTGALTSFTTGALPACGAVAGGVIRLP